MAELSKIQVTKGIYWVEAPAAGLYVLCGCPADSVKHLMKRGLIGVREDRGISYETGPNAILLSDVLIQNGAFANLAEFPVLQMLYRQGMLLPNHPNNTGQKPLLIGSHAQISAQMQYIYRGNYGLVSEEELMAAGALPDMARELMRMKLKFAFGRIHSTEELLDSVALGNDPVELRDGVVIQRLRLNVFEFRYRENSVTVDLNLPPAVQYESPYTLGFHDIRREYFGIIHAGEGDGWDVNRPAMSSVLMFQGKLYLLDAGPNILHSLNALGIGVNEIDGIFQTHAHDDHFAGLAALMRSDHPIDFYATALVRSSVAKKLAALTAKDDEDFFNYFTVNDLKPDVWNDIEGLEVTPMLSPHPVETNILLFRVMSRTGYKSYAHFADIVSLEVLGSMVSDDDSQPGVSRGIYQAVVENYLQPADVKKVDVGSGLIHGNAEDFRGDNSTKFILAHTSQEPTLKMKEIGCGAPFGTIDVLIHDDQDYIRMDAFNFFRSYLPCVPREQLRLLINNPVITFNPESFLLKSGAVNSSIYLIVLGKVETIDTRAEICNTLSAGALVGEISALTGTPSMESYLAKSFVHALELPSSLYLYFVKKNGLYDEIVRLQEKRRFLQKTWLFGESLSYSVESRLARAMEPCSYPVLQDLVSAGQQDLFVVGEGIVHLYLEYNLLEVLHSGDFWGEGGVLFNTPSLYQARTAEETVIYRIESNTLLDIPMVRWKLFETYSRRMEMFFNPGLVTSPIFQWRDEYRTNVTEMDEHHRQLFQAANALDQAVFVGENRTVIEQTLDFLLQYATTHFSAEENLMREHGVPEFERHQKQHEKFMEDVLSFKSRTGKGAFRASTDFVNFFKDWIINHILTEDRKYGPVLNQRGIS
jgi:hemerythrin